MRRAALSPAESVVLEIEKAGGTAVADGTSVTDWSGIRDLVARTVGDHGHLDAVVNNAGIVRDRMLTSLTEEDFDAVLAVHLKGTFTLTKHACDHWRSAAKAGGAVSGRVINTTSGTGLRGNLGQVPYGAAKAGIANLTLIAAMDMARYGVTVNAISPVAYTRMVATMPSMAGYVPDETWDALDPGNSSPVVAWLASAGERVADRSGAPGGRPHRVAPRAVDRHRLVRLALRREAGGRRAGGGPAPALRHLPRRTGRPAVAAVTRRLWRYADNQLYHLSL